MILHKFVCKKCEESTPCVLSYVSMCDTDDADEPTLCPFDTLTGDPKWTHSAEPVPPAPQDSPPAPVPLGPPVYHARTAHWYEPYENAEDARSCDICDLKSTFCIQYDPATGHDMFGCESPSSVIWKKCDPPNYKVLSEQPTQAVEKPPVAGKSPVVSKSIRELLEEHQKLLDQGFALLEDMRT